MRVYDRKEFFKFPPGTFFCKGSKWCFDNLSIKGRSLENDFLYIDLCNIDSNDSGQWVDRLEDSLSNGTSYEINKDFSRDGIFDEKEIFLVLEKKDLEFIKSLIEIAIK